MCIELHVDPSLSQTLDVQLEEKQQSLSSIEAKLKEKETSLTDSNKEKDTTIKTLQDQVCACAYRFIGEHNIIHVHV